MLPLLIELSVESIAPKDRSKLLTVLESIKHSEPDFDYERDLESGLIVVKGVSEEQLESIVERINHEVSINAGALQVAYRETITKAAEIGYTHKRALPGGGEFAKVKLIFEPLPTNRGFEFVNEIAGGAVSEEYIPGIQKGIESVKDTGILAGFPVIGFRVRLVDGAYHDVDSSVLAFEIAARAAFREAKPRLGMQLMEPVMAVEVTTPEEFMGDVMRDLNGRRSQIRGVESGGVRQIIVKALVPLANMFGYSSTLLKTTRSGGSYRMSFDHYEIVVSPPDDDNFRPAVGMRA